MYCIIITMAFIISNYSIFCKRDVGRTKEFSACSDFDVQ